MVHKSSTSPMATNPFMRFAHGAAPPASQSTTSVAIKTEYVSPETAPVTATRKRKLAVKTEPKKSVVSTQIKSEILLPSPSPAQEENEPDLDDVRVSQLRMLVETRAAGPHAPIDMYGTQACIHSSTASDATKRFQILVAALLSSQTQDGVTHAAMQRLHTRLEEEENSDTGEASANEGLSIAMIRAASVERIQELLVPVGFYRRKAQQLKQVADTLHVVYRGDIPRKLEDILALPGVGPKIARVILLLSWDDVDEGLIVDTHVHRLANRLRWVGSAQQDTKTPEQTREALEKWVPREYWRDFSRHVVGFGQLVCHAVYPKCGSCPLAPTCPSAFKYVHPSTKKSVTKRAKRAAANPGAEAAAASHPVEYDDGDDFVSE